MYSFPISNDRNWHNIVRNTMVVSLLPEVLVILGAVWFFIYIEFI
jgi:hypothetical protein